MGHQTKVLRCDAGSQEMSAVFAEAMAKEGIRIDPAAPNQQNENLAEIYIQQIKKISSVVAEVNPHIHIQYWPYLILYVANTINLTPNSLTSGLTPHFYVKKAHPDVASIFSCHLV